MAKDVQWTPKRGSEAKEPLATYGVALVKVLGGFFAVMLDYHNKRLI